MLRRHVFLSPYRLCADSVKSLIDQVTKVADADPPYDIDNLCKTHLLRNQVESSEDKSLTLVTRRLRWHYLTLVPIPAHNKAITGLYLGDHNLSVERGYTELGRQRVKMTDNTGAGSKHTKADQEYLDSLSARQLMDFRDYLFSGTYIARNASKFLDYEWVDIALLREYLGQPQNSAPPDAPTTRSSMISDPVRVKIEAPLPSVVKAEPQMIRLSQASADIKMRTLNESGREIFELLSDSEPDADEPDSDLEVMHALQRTSRSSSVIPPADHDIDSEFNTSRTASGLPSDDESGDDTELAESDTVWQDDGTSRVRIGKFRPTKKISVERMEYRKGPACLYPIHRIRTGIVVDLSDEKYHLRDPVSKELYTLNTVVINADNDSWEWAGGGTRGGANVTFAPGETPLDPVLRTAVRFELDDPVPRNTIIVAQQETRRREGNTAEERAMLFVNVIRNAKCQAVDSNGNKCRGGPILKPKPHGISRGHQLFVGCSGWTPKFQQGHRTHSIPDNVDENLVANSLAGMSLAGDSTKDTPPCSGIVHPHTGLKKKNCPHAHIVNGMQVQGQIHNYPCDATRAIYVPKDPSIRKVLIIHNETGHNHPMPTLIKVSFGLKDTYRQCIEAHGVLGATVSKIDNAQSTKMQLNGKTPSTHAAPLYNRRVKQDVLRTIKLEKYPDAILPIYHAEISKPLPERYVHSHIETQKGEKIIITFIPYLLMLLDDPGVTSFDGDTTFKGVEGKLNEWELTVFAKVVLRAASCVRAYITGASADFFEIFFDELQRVKLNITGKPLPFKVFVRGGNLLVTNVDMDAAQVLGLCRSVMKYNNPAYSGIPNDTPPEKVAPRFIKVCWRHGKEPVHDFKSLVSPVQFARLMDFTYIDSKESLDRFSSFVYDLKIKKISDWWRHKEMHEWIIPCIVKSQSLIPADIWDATPSTTNTNEAQHHWTNSLAGIKLSPVEALESRRKIDQNVADEIKRSMETGILSNPNNELTHRISRNAQRQSAIARKSRESREAADVSKELQLQIKASTALTKSLKEQLKATKGTSGKKKKSDETILSASSSGRVKTARRHAEPSIPATTQSDKPSSSTEAPIATTTTQSAEPLIPELYSAPDYVLSDFEFDSLMRSLEGATNSSSSTQHLASAMMPAFDPTLFDPTLFGLTADLNTLMPFSAPPGDLQGSMDLCAFNGIFSDAGATPDFGTFTPTGPSDYLLPLLPPPPPESPPAPSPTVGQVSEAGPSAPRSRRRRQEVDEANILHSTRVRAAPKRFAEEDVSSRPQKKAKGKQGIYLLLSFCSIF
ncbi:hypothetical protein C8J57DRAFT_1588616 [Mycena rebaudengoi]|nr:hypothetical protein C8J57DRAFT_1588616 [Mycena rebaudengoi]